MSIVPVLNPSFAVAASATAADVLVITVVVVPSEDKI